ncbi:MAG: hypothetical protein JXR76_19940 [Deltaproteobacteria bacterium]|nr:hypothetical protein [Deltaproteobacteria bacterium]
MSYKSFDASTMLAISGPWSDDTQDRPLLEGCPVTAGIVPIIVDSHNEVMRMMVASDNIGEKLKALTDQTQTLDGDHDDKFRSLHGLFTAMAAVSEEPRKSQLLEARDVLMPEGLMGVQRSFLAESANVEVAREKLTPEIEALLKDVSIGAKTMYDLFTEWLESGRKLGAAERKRAQFQEESAAVRVTARDLQQARYRWIRTVNALAALLELDYNFPKDMRTRILQPLRTTEAKQSRTKTAAPEASDTPDSSDDENAQAV